MGSDYEYRGLMAETWDWLRGDPTGRFDRDFYCALIETYGQPVLEVGCGTGRLLLDFLEAGIEIEGVDISPEMLALCAMKGKQHGLSPVLYQQPIETLALPKRYQTILASSSVLQLITDPLSVEQAMAHLYAHLIPAGALVAPFMTLWREGMPMQREWEHAVVRETDGAVLQRMGRIWYDPGTECENTEDLYQVIVDGEVKASEHHRRLRASRSYTIEQAECLFEKAGFAEIRILQGYTNLAATMEDRQFTVIGVRE